ncbi:MAG: hypothetical protein R3B41_00320 [Candidatus Doudnabacteria bacterium]
MNPENPRRPDQEEQELMTNKALLDYLFKDGENPYENIQQSLTVTKKILEYLNVDLESAQQENKPYEIAGIEYSIAVVNKKIAEQEQEINDQPLELGDIG